ncbi:CG16775, partial [Drosophila busckii]
MNSAKHLTIVALVLAQLLLGIECATWDRMDTWIDGSKTLSFPDDAVLGGFDPQGYDNFVGRALYSNGVWPARVVAETGVATYNTETISNKATTYEILVSNGTVSYHWVRSFDGHREKNAVSVGTNAANDRVYVCRCRSDNGLIIGTLLLADRRCYVRYDNMPQRTFDKYEILVRQVKLAPWVPFVSEYNPN